MVFLPEVFSLTEGVKQLHYRDPWYFFVRWPPWASAWRLHWETNANLEPTNTRGGIPHDSTIAIQGFGAAYLPQVIICLSLKRKKHMAHLCHLCLRKSSLRSPPVQLGVAPTHQLAGMEAATAQPPAELPERAAFERLERLRPVETRRATGFRGSREASWRAVSRCEA